MVSSTSGLGSDNEVVPYPDIWLYSNRRVPFSDSLNGVWSCVDLKVSPRIVDVLAASTPWLLDIVGGRRGSLGRFVIGKLAAGIAIHRVLSETL